jgi:YD repeat-containing protein
MKNGSLSINGKNNELLSVADNSQRLKVEYRYDVAGREVLRTYGNGVRQETKYDGVGRVILIRETGARSDLIRGEAVAVNRSDGAIQLQLPGLQTGSGPLYHCGPGAGRGQLVRIRQ